MGGIILTDGNPSQTHEQVWVGHEGGPSGREPDTKRTPAKFRDDV